MIANRVNAHLNPFFSSLEQYSLLSICLREELPFLVLYIESGTKMCFKCNRVLERVVDALGKINK